uniref:Peptide-N-glycosidase F C-terminal domain-containing protein n=1 Tax=Hucho hucho TaxID=62062 RepID=A0A4W5N975_9TELE
MSLYSGGTFDKEYKQRYQPIKFTVPASTKKVELYAVIPGHRSDENSCGEFCVTSHHFLVNGAFNHTRILDSAGSALGCAMQVGEGAVPTWRIDITTQLDMGGIEANTLLYFGLYSGQDPNPSHNPGNIVMFSYLVFYK